VDIFSIFNQFVYTRQLCDELESDLGWDILVKTWLFADKYLVPSLQNKSMSTLFEKNRKVGVIPTHCVKLIYNNTLPGSLLRKFIIDLVAYKLDIERCITHGKGGDWSHEALLDLVRILGTKEKTYVGNYVLPDANNGKCHYHIHADGENCDTKL